MMMCQPGKWWWGLLPLVLLFMLMNAMKSGPIEGDLARLSADEFTRSGLPWAKATLSGRDAVLAGEAPDPESKKLAIDAASRAWGVRLVRDDTTVEAEQKPYVASATREGNTITLSGFVPNDPVRAAMVKAAKEAFPNAQVVDQLKHGRGAPAVYAPALGFGLTQLGDLVKGTASLSDSAFSLIGQARDFAAFDKVLAAVKALPAGSTLGKAEITAPAVSPYVFTATKSADSVNLTGYIPSESVRAPLLDLAGKTPGIGRITDSLRVADGVPAGLNFQDATRFMLTQLGMLKSGVASLANQAVSLKGEAPTVAVFEAVSGTVKGALPGGLSLGELAVTGPVASPYRWSAQRAAGVITLAGTIPSESVRPTVLDRVKAVFPSDRVVDNMTTALGAPEGFAAAVSSALGQLGKLATGAASLTDKALRITGETFDKALPDQVKSALGGSALPAGFAVQTDIAVKEPPLPVVSPFTVSATKSDKDITLAGHIPAEAARTPLVALARAAIGSGSVMDQLRPAQGLPGSVQFDAATQFMLGQLGKLSAGSASLRDNALTVSGTAPDVATYEAVVSALKGALPGGLKLAAHEIKGPTVSPYVWSASRAADSVTLSGYIPSDSLRAPMIDNAKAMFSGLRIVDQMKTALGAPEGFALAVASGLAQLARLDVGVASLTDKVLKVVGETKDRALPQAIGAVLSGTGLPAGFRPDVAVTVKAPPPPPPAPVRIAPPELPTVSAVIPPAPKPVAPPPVSIAPPDLPAVDAVIPPAPPVAPPPVAAAPVSTPMPNLPEVRVQTPPVFVPAPAAPVAQAVDQCQVRLNSIVREDNIRFATASARINSASDPVLKLLVEAVAACPSLSIEVQGHTDSDGSEAGNIDLSNRRANAVAAALEARGVPKGKLTAKGYGQSQPVAPNDTAENKAKNRRIHFVVKQ